MKNNATKKQASANATDEPSAANSQPKRKEGYYNWLKIKAKAGTVERTLSFPIKPEFEDWLWELDALYGDPDHDPNSTFELEGNGRMKISLSIVNFQKKF